MVDLKKLEKEAKNLVCGECGATVHLAWGGKWGIMEYIKRCGRNIDHKLFVRRGDDIIERIKGMRGLATEEEIQWEIQRYRDRYVEVK